MFSYIIYIWPLEVGIFEKPYYVLFRRMRSLYPMQILFYNQVNLLLLVTIYTG